MNKKYFKEALEKLKELGSKINNSESITPIELFENYGCNYSCTGTCEGCCAEGCAGCCTESCTGCCADELAE